MGFATSVILNAPQEHANTQSDTALANANEVGYNQTTVESGQATSQAYEDLINDTELRDHIENVQPSRSGRNGIIGGHKKDSFLTAVQKNGAKIISTTPHPTIAGVETIYYQMPALTIDGKPSGGYRKKVFKKTVYNSDIFSTDQFTIRGLQAAENTAKQSLSGTLGQKWNGYDNQDIMWEGFCNGNSGEIKTFYPKG